MNLKPFYPRRHHGYDSNIPEMYTGFIAYGNRITKGGHSNEIDESDSALLVAKLLGIEFNVPGGKMVEGVLAHEK